MEIDNEKSPLAINTELKTPRRLPPDACTSGLVGNARAVPPLPQTPLAAPRHLIEKNISHFILILAFYLEYVTVAGLVVHVESYQGMGIINICACKPRPHHPPLPTHSTLHFTDTTV
ncbi:hypothetical protein J6590_074446 [Homalodisca vitripennis]|nr:hypothetical protein J6590_102486 [Homalodisca vitripennis]KAG8295693.1 hypothetical protein J6590_074446 [Homalodisca vitripennis]